MSNITDFYEPLPHQQAFHECSAPYRLMIGGYGCLAAGTIIADGIPVEDWTGGIVRGRYAGPAFLKGVAALYRVSTRSGKQVVVTDEHRFLSPIGFCPLSSLHVGTSIAADDSGRGDSASERSAGSRGRCSEELHRRDGLPHPFQAAFLRRSQRFRKIGVDSNAQDLYALLSTENFLGLGLSPCVSLQDSLLGSTGVGLLLRGPANQAADRIPKSRVALRRSGNDWQFPQEGDDACASLDLSGVLIPSNENNFPVPPEYRYSFWDEITEIHYVGNGEFYDLCVPGFEHYSAAGLWHHNSGKTLAVSVMEGVITALMVPGCNVLVLRTTSPDLQKTVIDKALNPRLVPPWIYKSYNRNEKVMYFQNGSKIFFGYCSHEDDLNQFLSTEFVYIALEEAGEFSYRVFEALSGRLRVSTDVKDINGNSVKPSMGLATNPFGIGYASWIKPLFIEKRPLKGMGRYDATEFWYNHSTVKDNPFTYNPTYVAKLEGMTGTLRAQALYGDLNVVSGQYYPQFNAGQHEGIHVMDPSEIKFQPWQPCWMASDFDADHWPFLWFTKAQIPDKINGGMRTVTVVYRERIFEPENASGKFDPGASINSINVADWVAKSCRCETDDQGRIKKVVEPVKRFYFSWERFKRNQGDTTIAQTLGNRLKRWGLPFPQPAHSSREDGWVYIGQQLDTDSLIITSDCPVLIQSLSSLIRDTPNDPEDVKEVSGGSLENDIGDALRYGLASQLPTKGMPQSVKDNMALDAIRDPVARQIHSYELWLKKQGNRRATYNRRVLPWQKTK